LLLLAHRHDKGLMTSKVFEYLGAGRPILSIPSDGDVIDALLSETGAGASASTAEEVGRILLEYYREWRDGGRVGCRGDSRAIARYTRRSQAARLAEVLAHAF
jgi:hypothetical protein